MQTQNMFVGRFPELKKQNSFESSKYLNLPDLEFFIWCNKQYRLNRGIYNVIDQWFYEYGVINVQYRRIQLLAFLEFMKDELLGQDQTKFIRFGHGGLRKKLNEFIQDNGKSNVISLKK